MTIIEKTERDLPDYKEQGSTMREIKKSICSNIIRHEATYSYDEDKTFFVIVDGHTP